jgi:hypothetical protein
VSSVHQVFLAVIRRFLKANFKKSIVLGYDKCQDSEQKCSESFLFCADFVNQYDKRESVIALPFPISESTLRLVGNDEVGLRALSVRRGAQGDTAAGIG